jgi:hypothetical protein
MAMINLERLNAEWNNFSPGLVSVEISFDKTNQGSNALAVAVGYQ